VLRQAVLGQLYQRLPLISRQKPDLAHQVNLESTKPRRCKYRHAGYSVNRSKKTFDSCGICHGQRQMLQAIKVFLLLFVHKKKSLLRFLHFQTHS
jgi:hypothetical protein